MTPFRLSPALVIAAALCAGFPAATRGQIVDSSPFAPVDSGPGGGGPKADTDSLELRGILNLSSGAVFCIYDVGSKTGTWAKLGTRMDTLLVRSYDPVHESVVVESGGRVMHLVLKESKVESDHGGGVEPGGGRMPAGYAIPTAADEARRLQLVAQEIQRRRMLRQQALRSLNPGVPLPPGGGQPPAGPAAQPQRP